MKKKAVYKPKSNIYRKIINITQSVLYTPKTEEWFEKEFADVKIEELREALLYLCHTHYLEKQNDGTYSVDIDFRTKIRGIYHFDGVNGHVHADSIRKLYKNIHIPSEWTLGALHNDRVEVSIEGELSDDGSPVFGVVNKVIQNFGEMFVGKLQKIDGRWFVLPEEKEVGNFIEAQEFRGTKKSGTCVLARINSDNKTCTILKALNTEKERLLYKYGFYPEIEKTAEDEFMSLGVKPGKPVKRFDFTETPAMLLNGENAVCIEKNGQTFKVLFHVPDICDRFVPDSASEKELLRRCAGENFLPRTIREKAMFTDGTVKNAFTVIFDVDNNGNVSNSRIERSRVLTIKKKDVFYQELCDALSLKGGLISAANDAAAMWFDKNDAPAPFVNIYFTDEAKAFINILKKDVSYENILNIMQNVKDTDDKISERLVPEFTYFQANAFGEENITVPFCNPLSNYLSLLSQYCFVQQNRLRLTEKKNEHLRFVFERAALYNLRQLELKRYLRASSNVELDKELVPCAEYEGIFITKTDEGKKALFLVENSIGTVKNPCLNLKTGDRAWLCYEGLSLDRQELLFKEKRK